MQIRSFDAHTFYEQESEQCIVLLPGLGYLFDRPLLRCARTLALQHGFCVLELSFGALPYDKAKMKESIERCVPLALQRAEAVLPLMDGKQLHFIAKSFGTVIAGLLRPQCSDHPAFFLTPLKQTLPLIRETDHVAYGDGDRFLDAQDLQDLASRSCRKLLCPGADHSLRHPREEVSERYLREVCAEMERFLDEI